jgi:PHP family Zn ribbon phosphoesterase
MELSYDLHTHSCLSPCADDDMTVNNIVNMAALCELDILALTDHNSLKNCPAFFSACKKTGIIPVAGVEVCTREEVHVLCLFPTLESGMEFDSLLGGLMPDFVNEPRIYGRQLILDRYDNVTGEEPRLLIAACDVGIDELPGLARHYGGIAIPSHIDRPSNSLISNLGFIPDDYEFRCYEIKDSATLPQLMESNPALRSARIIYDSDAHTLTDIAENRRSVSLEAKSAPALIDYLSGVSF